uniref:Pinin/SDK/MemA protein domain-containing protein n=1 Tax=Scylla olivacea TaxID=85551 RepID=A0A0N7ZDI6_SCYOL
MAGVSGVSLVNTIQSEIERARQDLKGVDENLRRLTGRDFNDPNQRPDLRRVRLASGSRDDEPPAKRRPPGGVFARLGAVVLDQQHPEPRGRPRGDLRNELRGDHRGIDRGDPHTELRSEEPRGRRVQEVMDTEDKLPKPSLASSVARPVPDSKSRSEAAAELTKDRASRDRNRRMFGALLGTLKRFKNDEAKQKDKEEQRAAIERKLEEKGRAEKEELRRERLELFNQRKERQAQIRRLTIKMARVKEHEVWEAHQMKLAKFIRTESSPAIFWVPRLHNARTTGLVRTTHDKITGELEQDRLRMKEELDEILGSRGEDREGADLVEEEEETFIHRGLRSQVAKQGEGGGNDPLDNCPDLLDYEAEEGELVYDEADLSGKDDNDDTERMVVQVDGRGEGGRKVEIVASQPGEEDGEEGKSGAGLGNDSEKENEGRRKDRDRNREERHRERDSRKNRDKGREKDRNKDKEGESHKGKDRPSGKEKERVTARDSHKEVRKEGTKSKDSSEAHENESDLSATIVHIKIEKEDDTGITETTPVLKIIKEEKPDKAPASGKKTENSEVTVPAGGASPVAVAADGSATSTADIELPPPAAAVDPAQSPANSSKQPSISPTGAASQEHSVSPIPMNPSPPAKTVSEGDRDNAGESKSLQKDKDTNIDLGIGDQTNPEPPSEKQQNLSSDTTVPDKQTSGMKDVSTKVPARAKLQKDDKRKSKRDKLKKKTDKRVVPGTKKNSGSSDESSSGSSESSSDSSESDSSDSDSSSSSSSDSGSSSDSESDSSFSSSSHSDSDSDREKRKRKRARRSRSDDSSSDSETEGKGKRRVKTFEKSKQLREDGKISKSKGREELHSDDDKAKKEVGKRDKFREGRKGKEREESRKSKETDKGRERDLELRKEKEVAKRGGSREKRDRNREQRKERSRSREDRRGGRKDRR